MDEFWTVFDYRRNPGFAHNRWTACVQAYAQAEDSLFSYAKPAENDAQQVVGSEFTGNLTKGLLGQA